jgi:hypothetical protein
LPGDVCIEAKDLPPVGLGTIVRIMHDGADPGPPTQQAGRATVSDPQANDFKAPGDAPSTDPQRRPALRGKKPAADRPRSERGSQAQCRQG